MTTRQDFYIHDPKNLSNIGDIVLAKKLDFFHTIPENWEAPVDWEIAGKEVWFELEKVIFKAGAVIDPLTGLKVDGSVLLSDEKYDRGSFNAEKLAEPARFLVPGIYTISSSCRSKITFPKVYFPGFEQDPAVASETKIILGSSFALINAFKAYLFT